MKARCLTIILEYELVQMTAVGLNLVVRKKMINQQLRDMSQLADTSRKIENLNPEKKN